jgi:uncharacterized protein YbaR (Trm112 family)
MCYYKKLVHLKKRKKTKEEEEEMKKKMQQAVSDFFAAVSMFCVLMPLLFFTLDQWGRFTRDNLPITSGWEYVPWIAGAIFCGMLSLWVEPEDILERNYKKLSRRYPPKKLSDNVCPNCKKSLPLMAFSEAEKMAAGKHLFCPHCGKMLWISSDPRIPTTFFPQATKTYG